MTFKITDNQYGRLP